MAALVFPHRVELAHSIVGRSARNLMTFLAPGGPTGLVSGGESMLSLQVGGPTEVEREEDGSHSSGHFLSH